MISSVYLIIAACVALVFSLWKAHASGKKAGSNEAKAKGADAYEKHINEISDAAIVRNGANSVPFNDKYRRD